MSASARILVVLAVAAALGSGAIARVSEQGDAIRGGVDLVTVDFAAVGPDGNPVADLTIDQVQLKVGGRIRPIKSFQYVQAAGTPPRTGVAGPFKELSPPFGSNYVGDAGRTIVLIVENESLRPAIARHTTDAAAKFVSGLSPRDRVALVTMPRGGLQIDLTRDHARVQQLLAGVSGQASQRDTESAKSCRSRETLMALSGLLEGLVGFDVAKTIVFISGGILTARRDAPLTGPPGPCEIRPVHYDDVAKAAVEARANFFVIKSDDLVIDSAANAFTDPAASRFRSADEELAGLESLAGVTSGLLLRMNPSDHSAFKRVARETSGYYLMAFDPDAPERNGLSHRIDVEVSRPQVAVRVRPRLTIPRPFSRSSAPSLTPQAMLRDGKLYSDLPLRAAAFASVNPGDTKLKVIALAEPLDRTVSITSAAFALIGNGGRLVAQWTANERELSRSPMVSGGLALPGHYRLRVAAVDNLGRRGATDYEFEASLREAGPLKLSTLVLGVSRGNFVPRLQFIVEPTAMGYFEVYGALPNPEAASVALELATTLEGPAIVRVPATMSVTDDPLLRRVSGVVPLGAMPAGDYVVRGIVSVDGKELGQVTRTLRKASM
jgi:VWFA-related protein